MSDTPRTDEVLERYGAARGIMLGKLAKELERELNAAKAEIADNLALIKRLHRAISARMCADEPTSEERLELMHAWTAAQETIDKAKEMNFRPYHNPENIDESLVPDGWRFRYADEMKTKAKTECTSFLKTSGVWDDQPDYKGISTELTYIVPVTP